MGPVGESSTRGIPSRERLGWVWGHFNGIPGQTAGNPHLQLSLVAFFLSILPVTEVSSGLRVLLRTPAAPPSPVGHHSPFPFHLLCRRACDATFAAATFTATPCVAFLQIQSGHFGMHIDGCISQVSCVCAEELLLQMFNGCSWKGRKMPP